jgi:O-antigen/teichoic acid export membrane protein
MFRTSLPLTLGTIFLTIHTEIDKILLGKLSTFEEVAHYGVSIRLSAAAAPIPLVMAAIAAPELTRLLKRGDVVRSRRLTDVSLRVLVSAAGVLALLTTCMSHEIVNVVFGAKYAGASPVLVWVGWLLLPIFVGTLLMEFSVAAGQMWLLTSNTAVGMIVVILGDVLLIPSYGAQGAMASKLVAVFSGALVIVLLARRSPYLDLKLFSRAASRTGAALGLSVGGYALLDFFSLPRLFTAAATITIYIALLVVFRVTTLGDVTSLYKKIFRNASA